MKKSQIHPKPEYFDRYIDKTEDLPLMEVLEKSLRELNHLPLVKLEALGNLTYAEGKWTVKDIFQHLCDTERIFTYRALAFSRNETGQVLGYEEDHYARHANANNRELNEIIRELVTIRASFVELFRSFTPEMLLKTGKGFKGDYSVLAIGFMMPGHQRWHLDVIDALYLPMLESGK